MSENKARIGDYVTAKVVGKDDCRQGVFFQEQGNGTITVKGVLADYTCESGPAVVADKNVFRPETRQHIQAVRRQLGLGQQ
jgi:hypothetical protein